MAGRGPVPKAPEQRRRRNAPERGEWTVLEPLAEPVLGVADKGWSAPARALWVGWRQDPVTAHYGPSEIAAVAELARVWEDLQPSEQRLRMDGLGLSLKGKRDLRFRMVSEVEAVPERPKLAEVRRIRAVV